MFRRAPLIARRAVVLSKYEFIYFSLSRVENAGRHKMCHATVTRAFSECSRVRVFIGGPEIYLLDPQQDYITLFTYFLYFKYFYAKLLSCVCLHKLF